MSTSRIPFHSVLIFTLLLCNGCGDDEEPIFEPDDCIGSAGGEVEFVQEGDALNGTKVIVAPDTWDKCWSVYVWGNTTFTTPNFPDGLHGHQGILTGSLDITIQRQVSWEETVLPPDSLDLSISFPLNGYTTGLGEVATAFRWEEEAGLWRVALPSLQDATRLEVETHHHGQLWTWGKVDLGEADFELYMEPALEQMMGTEAWTHVQTELQALHDSIVQEQLAIRCDNLAAVRDVLAATGEYAAGNLRSFQDGLGGLCGQCDVTTLDFYENLLEYFKLNAQAYVAELMLVENSPHWLLHIAGNMMVAGYRAAIAALPCDVECFFGETTAEFYGYLAVYYACLASVEVIEYAMSPVWLNCP